MKTFRRELNKADLERMNLPRRYWNVRFSAISDHGGDKSPKAIVGRYLANLERFFDEGVGLLLYGPNGRGKTAIAAVIGKEYRRRGCTVLFIESAGIKDAVVNKKMFDDDTTLWDRALNVDVLILDDLGKGVQDGTGFGARLLDELIRYRNARKLVTFITTNMEPRNQLREELKQSTMHTLKECVIPLFVDGPDKREDSKEELNEMILQG